MFKKHFKDNPVHTKQLVVNAEQGQLIMTLEIYQNGDIFVDYGRGRFYS